MGFAEEFCAKRRCRGPALEIVNESYSHTSYLSVSVSTEYQDIGLYHVDSLYFANGSLPTQRSQTSVSICLDPLGFTRFPTLFCDEPTLSGDFSTLGSP